MSGMKKACAGGAVGRAAPGWNPSGSWPGRSRATGRASSASSKAGITNAAIEAINGKIQLGRVNTNERFDDQREADEAEEHHVEFLEAREDAAEAFEPSEQSFDLVALLVDRAVVLPRVEPVGLRRNHRNEAQIERQLPGFIAFVGAIHQQVQGSAGCAQAVQQGAPCGASCAWPGRQGKHYGRSSIRGNHMNLGVPSAAGFPDGLRSVFFNAPVPSG